MAQTPMNPVSGCSTREPGISQAASDWDRPDRESTLGKGGAGLEPPRGTVGEQVKEQTGAMMEAAKGLAEDAKEKVQEAVEVGASKAQEAKDAAGAQMHNVADKIRQGSDVVSEKADQFGTYLQQHDFGAIGHDLTEVVRRYPVQSLLVGIGLGILLGRAAR